jgi:hypothetical protein
MENKITLWEPKDTRRLILTLLLSSSFIIFCLIDWGKLFADNIDER